MPVQYGPLIVEREDKLANALRASVAILRPKRIRYATPDDVGYHPLGGARELFERDDRLQEIVLDGPAGTGKTLAALWRFHLLLHNYPNSRALAVRKTQASLTASALDTYRRYVLARESFGATYYGGSGSEPEQYRYPNGSALVIGGLDNANKFMSAEFDGILVNEATEATEDDWEKLIARRRLGVWPVQIMLGDVNPQAPTHWLNQRMNRTPGMRILSHYEDNPRYWNLARNDWTPEGRDYVVNTLGRLTGVRLQRLRYGKWVSAEGQIYETFSESKHVVRRDDPIHGPRIKHARRHIGAGDWGWNNPGVLGVFAIADDGEMYLVAEVYRTEEHVDPYWLDIAEELDREFNVSTWYLDPSEPQYIDKFNERGLRAEKATNAVKPGIDAVSARLAYDADHEPRLYFVEGALRYPDEKLIEKRKPFSSEQEIGEYVWARDKNGVALDTPAPGNDHGMDMVRYGVAGVDLGKQTSYAASDGIEAATLFPVASADRFAEDADFAWD